MDKEIINGMGSSLIHRAQNINFNANMMAILFHKKLGIISGWNRAKTHPLQAKYAKNPKAIYIHAEIDVIRQAMKIYSEKDFINSTLYVARIKRPKPQSKEWIWGLAKPCKGCMSAIEAFNIGRIIYTRNDQHYEEMER